MSVEKEEKLNLQLYLWREKWSIWRLSGLLPESQAATESSAPLRCMYDLQAVHREAYVGQQCLPDSGNKLMCAS